MEQINILFAGFVDDEADADKRKALMDNLKLLSSMKDSVHQVPTWMLVSPMGC